MNNNRKISIIGGAGHVGFPLGLIFSSNGYKVNLIDKNNENINKINIGIPPFLEEGGKMLLKKMLKYKRIKATNKMLDIIDSKYIIICIGTPINKNLDPKLKNFLDFFKTLKKYINRNQIIIIRSSVYPGICDKVYNIIKDKNKNLSYCPERIVQGKSIKELPNISQLVSGKNKKSIIQSSLLFKKICRKKIIKVKIIEAELVKLFSNAYRYIHFSISNQFFMICKNLDLDFVRIRNIMRDGYKRNAHIPMAGFAAGPCLLKDTMQLSSFYNHKFSLGHTAMSINEGLPKFLISQLSKKYNLKKKIIGILGLSFKAETDDVRDSLSIKLLRYLKSKKIKTLQSDEYFKSKYNIDKNLLVKKSDIIILSTPHKAYQNLKIKKNKVVVDIWGITKRNF